MVTNEEHQSPRVVLLRDARWPDQPGTCCWRESVHAAFAAAGATVDEVTWHPGTADEPRFVGLAARLHPVSERIARRLHIAAAWRVKKARRKGRAAWERTRGWIPSGRIAIRVQPKATKDKPGPPIPGLVDGALVLAESLDAAEAAVRGGAPRRDIWALLLPLSRGYHGAALDGGRQAANLVPRIRGFLTDSDQARESIERALAGARPQIVVFPPLATDRRCSACASTEARIEPVDPDAKEVDAGPLLLWRWRSLLNAADRGPVPFRDTSARLRGLAGPWQPLERYGWRLDVSGTSLEFPVHDTHPAWTAEAQEAGARRLLELHIRPAPGRDVRRAVITGFDLKFINELAGQLDRRSDLAVTLDDWPRISSGGPGTEALVDAADAVVAEWARPNAVWLSQRKRPEQTLIVRLHRYEIGYEYPGDIAIENVDAVVYIAPLMGRRIRDELGWPVDKLVYIPNYIDLDWLDRPKLPDARFALGLVGMVPSLKRLDLALDLLSRVRQEDSRFTLFVRSAMPWGNDNVWVRDHEREFFGWCFDRIEADPLLRSGVVFDRPGRDMARWYRKTGAILSLSDIEGSHLSLADGMASGCVPVIRPWPGAEDLYGKEWIHPSIDDAAEFLLGNADPDTWAARSMRARAEIQRTHDPKLVEEAWADLLHGDIGSAHARFIDRGCPDLGAPSNEGGG